MKTSTLVGALAACACLLPSAALLADMKPTPSPTPAPTPAPALSAAEKTFVDGVTADLNKRFSTTAAAGAAGYFRYNDEDETGAISWVNTSWWTSDPQHPAQLWYDVKGRLLGADFSQPLTDQKPTVWGLGPSRWFKIELHVHYGLKGPNGGIIYGGGYGSKTAAKYGISLENPTPADVVKIGKAKSVSDVAFVFSYHAVWDTEVWVIPNPLGQFAEFNPNVVPSKPSVSM